MDSNSYAIINVCSDGSTGKIATGLHSFLLKNGIKSVFLYSRGPRVNNDNAIQFETRIEVLTHAILGRITGLQGYFSIFATQRLISQLKKHKVTHVFAGNLHGYYLNESMLLNYIAEAKIKLVYLMFDEYPFLGKCAFTKGCELFKRECEGCQKKREYPRSYLFNTSHIIYKRKAKNYKKLGDNCIFVAPEFEISLSQGSPIMHGMKTYVADEAIDTAFFKPRDVSNLKKALGIKQGQFVCVCIALFDNINHPKGAAYFIELAKKLEQNPNYIFVHVGYVLKDKSFLPSNYIPVGFIHNQDDLAQYYSLADLFVLPAIAESMPNTCLEALSCGSPLLCFNYGGMSKIASKDVATFVEPLNVEAMKEAVLARKLKDSEIIKSCRNYALERYDNQKYYQKLLDLAINL